jgi:hypothetical protein
MHHPHATIQNIFTFLWCIWKARNDDVFCRNPSMPHQIHQAAQALTNAESLQLSSQPAGTQLERNRERQSSSLLAQDSTLKSDLLITGTKVFSDASWQTKKIPGQQGQPATGVGVYIQTNGEFAPGKIVIQASTASSASPLLAEAAG